MKSDVWNFIDKTRHKTVKCKLCNKRYAYHGGTTNLHNHLNRIHSNKYKTKSKHDPTLDAFITWSKCTTSHAKRITDLIADMVAQDFWPAALVEGRGFEALLKYIKSGYKVPSATHIAQVVRCKHKAGKRLLKQKLTADSTSLAITTDIWTSWANDAYISLTAHFITSTWQMVSCILATSPNPRPSYCCQHCW